MRHALIALITLILAACSSHADSPRLPAAQSQCDFVNYHRDETVNVQGSGRCTTDCDCDGMRSCKDGACAGEARPTITDPKQCNDPSYRWNEAWNGGGSGVCANDCECNGTRTCMSGHCQDGQSLKPGDSVLTR
jgi:hypothetical protein